MSGMNLVPAQHARSSSIPHGASATLRRAGDSMGRHLPEQGPSTQPSLAPAPRGQWDTAGTGSLWTPSGHALIHHPQEGQG